MARVTGTPSDHDELFGFLVDNYLARVRRLMYQMTLDDADADDLTQEVFLKVWQKLDSFRGEAKVSTWLYRVAFNTAESFLRRQRRSPINSHAELPEAVAQRTEDPETVAASSELDGAIAAALASLPDKLRSAIVLTAIEGVESHEAARILGCARATLYWRIHKARKLLEQRLQAHL